MTVFILPALSSYMAAWVCINLQSRQRGYGNGCLNSIKNRVYTSAAILSGNSYRMAVAASSTRNTPECCFSGRLSCSAQGLLRKTGCSATPRLAGKTAHSGANCCCRSYPALYFLVTAYRLHPVLLYLLAKQRIQLPIIAALHQPSLNNIKAAPSGQVTKHSVCKVSTIWT